MKLRSVDVAEMKINQQKAKIEYLKAAAKTAAALSDTILSADLDKVTEWDVRNIKLKLDEVARLLDGKL